MTKIPTQSEIEELLKNIEEYDPEAEYNDEEISDIDILNGACIECDIEEDIVSEADAVLNPNMDSFIVTLMEARNTISTLEDFSDKYMMPTMLINWEAKCDVTVEVIEDWLLALINEAEAKRNGMFLIIDQVHARELAEMRLYEYLKLINNGVYPDGWTSTTEGWLE